MKLSHHILAVTGLFQSAVGLFLAEEAGPNFESLGLTKRADVDWFDIERKDINFGGDRIFQNSQPAVFLEAIQGIDKSGATSEVRDRSEELYRRQQCQSGYGYCASKIPSLCRADSLTDVNCSIGGLLP